MWKTRMKSTQIYIHRIITETIVAKPKLNQKKGKKKKNKKHEPISWYVLNLNWDERKISIPKINFPNGKSPYVFDFVEWWVLLIVYNGTWSISFFFLLLNLFWFLVFLSVSLFILFYFNIYFFSRFVSANDFTNRIYHVLMRFRSEYQCISYESQEKECVTLQKLVCWILPRKSVVWFILPSYLFKIKQLLNGKTFTSLWNK